MRNDNYPKSPDNLDEQILNPNREYKKEVIRVALSVLLFIIVYLLLISLSVGLAGIVSFLGINLIVLKPAFITLMIGLGLIGLGLMVVYFLVKFIFAIKKVDKSQFNEIHEKHHPELFAFLKQLSNETKAPFPKRIYLSPEVNASVFYDSSFLSMFFPVKKNLLIGLGFVNSVNMSEFKAVIAHEFGHFSQHSMKLGSYVFNVNRIIYNMLYDNQDYANTINKWASASGYFAFFARLTVGIVQAFQWVLQQVYVVVNKSNMSLSRQMEHHADAVSAFVSGPEHLISALKRLEISDSSYNILLNLYDKWISENIKSDNLFANHSEVLSHIAKENGFELENGLPKLGSGNQNNMKQSRIVIKDQWASHPSTDEREKYLKTLNIKNTAVNNESPWILFNDAKRVQKEITDKLFNTVSYRGPISVLNFLSFKEKFNNEINNNTFNKEFKGFYNNRRITPFDTEETIQIDSDLKYSLLSEIYTTENCSLPKEIEIINSEIELLNAIQGKQYQVKTFDFDGKKCDKDDIPQLLKLIENEKEAVQNNIDNIDKEVFKLLIKKAEPSKIDLIKNNYKRYFNIVRETENSMFRYNELARAISPIYQNNLSIEIAQKTIENVKLIEIKIIQQMRDLLTEAKENQYLNKNQFQKLDEYLSRERSYFNGNAFNNDDVNIFNEAMNLFVNMIIEREFQVKKGLLQMQLEIVGLN